MEKKVFLFLLNFVAHFLADIFFSKIYFIVLKFQFEVNAVKLLKIYNNPIFQLFKNWFEKYQFINHKNKILTEKIFQIILEQKKSHEFSGNKNCRSFQNSLSIINS